LQKPTDLIDVMRFRKYLGKQYSKQNNVVTVDVGRKKKDIPLPIYSLYFLCSDAGIDGVPVLEVDTVLRDVATGEIIKDKSNFVEALYHRGRIVQIKHLKEPRRTELEQLLSVFDQSKYSTNVHILDINEDDFPKKYRPLIRRLKMAASSPEIIEQMEDEDMYAKQMRDFLREGTEDLLNIIDEKDNTIAEKDNTIAFQAETIAEKDKALAQAEADRARLQAELERLLSSNKN
jgi:uncharacterized coiled-coil protein SlyX